KRKQPKLKVGHGGTLDAEAEGVLVIGVGGATKQLSQFLACDKSYEFDVELGRRTTTLDVDGEVEAEAPFEHVTADMLQAALNEFVGDIMQIPPRYSALRIDGKRLSDHARSGTPVDPQPRPVRVLAAQLQAYVAPVATIAVTCGGGFYVRSLARDLAWKVQSEGHVTRLVRTRQGRFDLSAALPEDAWTPAQLEAALAANNKREEQHLRVNG
ncbi:uncharacterized protein MONBRDRAFT_13301, partial [Monosiga brevicollis MX1]